MHLNKKYTSFRVVRSYLFFSHLYLRKSLVLVFTLLGSGILELAGLFTLMPLIGQTHPKTESVQMMWVGLLGSFLLLSSATRRLGEKLSFNLRCEIELLQRSKLVDDILQTPWKRLSGLDQSDLDTALVSEISQAVNGYISFLGLLPILVIAIIMLLSTLFLNYVLTLFALIIGYISFRHSRHEGSKQKISQAILAGNYVDLNRETSSLITNLKFLRASGYQRDWSNETKGRFGRISLLVAESLNGPSRAKWITEVSGIILLIGIMAFSVIQDHSISKSLVFIAILFRLTPRVQSAQSSWLAVVQQAEWMKRWIIRVNFFQHQKESERKSVTASVTTDLDVQPNSIEFHNVSISFVQRGKPAISNISFRMGMCERVALVGPSGSGKSTVIDVITGVLIPDSGSITIRGENLDYSDIETWQKKIAWTPQVAPLKTGSILQNLKWLNGDSSEAQMNSALKIAELTDFIETLPNGVETELNPKSEMSGGQGQRLALARALVREPSLLILDETTSALDESIESLIIANLDQLECGILISTHRMGPLAICNRVIALEEGRIVFDGTTSEYFMEKEMRKLSRE